MDHEENVFFVAETPLANLRIENFIRLCKEEGKMKESWKKRKYLPQCNLHVTYYNDAKIQSTLMTIYNSPDCNEYVVNNTGSFPPPL
jgi:hypothetical protein